MLALMLVLIIGSSYFLVTKLNINLALTQQSEETGLALSAAKDALIGYAITFPDHDVSGVVDGPGYLPCPDLNNDGSAVSSCSAGGNTTIGRLPNQTLRLEELRDASGQRLWYALSENFRFGNNKTIPLNSESPSSAELSVNGTGDIVAVIIAPGVPVNGQSRDPSDTSITSEISNYLEGDNNNLNTSFVTTLGGTTRKDGEYDANDNYIFNDRLVVITRQELMEVVEKRVLGEVRKMLTDYFNNYGAYPWLTPFADPKTDMRRLRGDAGPDSTGLVLDDNNQDFNEWGVAVNDVVYNITDGSIGTISNVNDSTRITVSSLLFGTLNAFADDDVYIIVPSASSLNSAFSGTASAGSSGLVLEDTSKNFKDLGVAAGDIVENLSDISGSTWSSGMVESVSATQITVKAMSGGTENDFDPGENYQIRSNVGQATGGSGGQVLEDTRKNFNVMNVLAGDLVINHSDGSVGRVTAVTANTLTVDELNFGTNNVFANNDDYSIPRYNTANATREGLLSFHEVGEYFRTGFSLDWDITQANGAQRVTTISAAPSADASYTTALGSHVEGALGTVNVAIDTGQCIWTNEEIIECKGINKGNFLQGATTSGSNSVFLIDSGKNFNTYGIKPGDVIQNYDDTLGVAASGTAVAGSGELLLVDTATDFNLSPFAPYPSALYGFVITKNNNLNEIAVVAEIISGPNAGQSNTLRLIPSPADTNLSFSAGDTWQARQPQQLVVNSVTANDTIYTVQTTTTLPDMDANEYYRILTATGRISGTVGGASFGSFLEDPSADFSNIQAGDIVENTTDGAFGIITSVSSGTTLNAQLYLPTNPRTITTRNFNFGESYVIHYDYVGARRYELETRYSGVPYVHGVNAIRKRDVCIGYEDISSNPDCSPTATTQATALPSNNNIATVTIIDLLDITENTASTATITIDGSTSGSMRLSDTDYYLWGTSGELPDWFIINKWHQLIYVAYSDGDSPNGGATCTPGTDCLTLTGGGSPDNNKRAMVIIAGEETNTNLDASCSLINPADDTVTAMQDRSTGLIYAYYEGETCSEGGNKYGVLDKPPASSFDNLGITNKFNDQIRVLDTSP